MVDKLDMKILELLEADGSLSFSEIARRLKLSESTVRKRVLSLKGKGVIKKFTIIVDPTKMGMNTSAIVGFDVAPERLLEVAQKLVEMPEVKQAATSTGDHMIMTVILAEDGKHLAQILSKKIGSIPGVRKVCPAIILEILKQ